MGNDIFKILCFGDSTTAADFSTKDPSYVKEYRNLKVYSQWLEEKLPKRMSRKVEVINSGVSGDTTNDAKLRFQKEVLSHRPNLVSIQFGVNDQCIRQDLGLRMPMVPLDQFAYNLLFFISRIKKTGAKVILMTPGMLLWNEVFKTKYYKAPYNLTEKYGLNKNLEHYIDMIRKIALIESVQLIDIFKYQLDYDAQEKYSMSPLLPDGLHPNNKGHKFIADAMLRELLKTEIV